MQHCLMSFIGIRIPSCRNKLASHTPVILAFFICAAAALVASAANANPSRNAQDTRSAAPGYTEKVRPQRDSYFSYAPSPEYPLPALRSKRNGVAYVRMSFDKEGNVAKVVLLASNGHRDIDGEVLRTVKKWKARPSAPREIDMPFKFFIRTPKAAADGGGLMMRRGVAPEDGARHE